MAPARTVVQVIRHLRMGDYVTSYLWKDVLQKDSLLDIIQKFINLQVKKEKVPQKDGTQKEITKKSVIFPRYHQMDVVRQLIQDVRTNGPGKNYLVQHSAGSGEVQLHRLDRLPARQPAR